MCQAIGQTLSLQEGTNRCGYCPCGLRTQTQSPREAHPDGGMHTHTYLNEDTTKVHWPNMCWVKEMSNNIQTSEHNPPCSLTCIHPSCNQLEFH